MADDTTTTETQSARRTHRGLDYSITHSKQRGTIKCLAFPSHLAVAHTMSMVLPPGGAEVEAFCGEAEWICHSSVLCHGKPYSLPALPGEYEVVEDVLREFGVASSIRA